MLLSNSFREMHDLLETVNHHAAAVGMLIKASKTKVVSALMSDEMCQAVLLDGDSFKYALTPKRSEAGLILPVPHSLARNPAFDRSVRYHCVLRAEFIRQLSVRFCSLVVRRGQYEPLAKGC